MTALSKEEIGRLADLLETQHDIEELGKLPADWNGYGAEPISPAIIEAAVQLLDAVPLDAPFVRPQVVPMTRGRLQLEWNSPNRSLELEFASPTQIEYLKIEGADMDEQSLDLPSQAAEAYSLLRWIGGG